MTEQEEREIEQIEAFYKGTLSLEELHALKQRMADDHAFKEKVNEYRQVMDGVKAAGIQEFMEELKGWEKEIEAREKTIHNNWPKIISIAAMLVIVMIPIGYIAYNYLYAPSAEGLYARYFVPYEDVISERGEKSNYTGAMSAYNLENYTEAVPLFETYLAAHPNDIEARSYLGIAQMATNNLEGAKRSLQQVRSNADGLFKEVADWYLCLTFLKLEDNKAFDTQLKHITDNPDHMFFIGASELQQALDR